MPAPFAAQLCGYRVKNDNPNTSDNGDNLSIELGHALFEELGVPSGQRVGENSGEQLESAVVKHLQPVRPDLAIRRSRSAMEFEQYEHLGVFPQFGKKYKSSTAQLKKLWELAKLLPESPQGLRLRRQLEKSMLSFAEQEELVKLLMSGMPEESFLKLDITCGDDPDNLLPHLYLGLSAKWSLRTDRAQDCISQGAKLVSQRRGPMPHYAVITMEPRPSMLKILAAGSGSVDYVYHLDLPALTRAIDKMRRSKSSRWNPGLVFDKLIQQGRIRDYDDLVDAVREIPGKLRRSGAAAATVSSKATGKSDAEIVESPDDALGGFDIVRRSRENIVASEDGAKRAGC